MTIFTDISMHCMIQSMKLMFQGGDCEHLMDHITASTQAWNGFTLSLE